MKRKISLLLSTLMVMAMMLQVNVFAVEDTELQVVVKAVKSKFTIPADYTEFEYRSRSVGDGKVWMLNWRPKGGENGNKNVHAEVDDKGFIISYSYSRHDGTINKKKLPKLSRQDAKIKAEDFIKKMDANLLGQVRCVENKQQGMEYADSFQFERVVNGIAFPQNYIDVAVDRETGEIVGYSSEWTDGLVFPAKDKAISMEKAQSAYKDKLGLQLIYRAKTEDKKIITYPAYLPRYSHTYIDALTGERITNYLHSLSYSGYDDYPMDGLADMANGKYVSLVDVKLSPDEIKAIEEVSNIIKKEDIEKKLRSLKILEINDDFSVVNAFFGKSGNNSENLVWNFHFAKARKGANENVEMVAVDVDARSGEILSFATERNYESNTVKYDKNAAQAAVEGFLKEIQPDKYKETEYVEDELEQLEKEINPGQYNFQYRRKVNGVFFPSNYINTRFDAVSGKITGYSVNWLNTTFQPVNKVMALDKMYDTLFNEVGLELKYCCNDSSVSQLRLGSQSSTKKPEINLVYVLKNNKPALYDAFTGNILTSDGKPFEEVKAIEYKDIKGHFAEKQIKVLAEYGIALEGDEFNPNKSILQKDFVKILCGILYYGDGGTEDSKDNSQMDKMYTFLINQDVIKEGEKAPDSVVTREDSVKFIIRSLKYDKVADLKGLFYCTFKDRDRIDPNLIGYVAIANVLGIIKGGYGCFYPKKALTRAEAMVEAYNYLQN